MFTNLSSNEGSRPDQVGITSEIASVIREFTEPLSENENSYPGKMANDASVSCLCIIVHAFLVGNLNCFFDRFWMHVFHVSTLVLGQNQGLILAFFAIQFLVEAEKLNSRVFLVAAAGSSDGLQPQIRRCFSHEISMSPLNEAQRISMLSRSLRGSIRTLDKVFDFLLNLF